MQDKSAQTSPTAGRQQDDSWIETVRVEMLPYLVEAPRPDGSKGVAALSVYDESRPVSSLIAQPTGLDLMSRDMEAHSVEVETLINLGFSNTVDVTSKTKGRMFLYVWNLMHHTPTDGPLENPEYAIGSAIKSATWGAGARIAIVGWELDERLSVTNPSGLAGAVDSNVAGSYFEVQLLGTDRAALQHLTPLLSAASGKYDQHVHQALLEAKAALIRHFASRERRRTLVPALLSADVDLHRLGNRVPEYPLEGLMASENYAIEQAVRQKICNESLAGAEFQQYAQYGHHLYPELIRKAYREVVGLGPDSKPDSRITDPLWERAKAAGS